MNGFEFNYNIKTNAGDPSLTLRMTGPLGVVVGKKWRFDDKYRIKTKISESPLLSLLNHKPPVSSRSAARDLPDVVVSLLQIADPHNK